MHCWLLTSLLEQKSKCRWSRGERGGCTAALIPVPEPALRVRIAMGRASPPCWAPIGATP